MNHFDREILADYTRNKPEDFRRRFYRAYMQRRKGVGPAICLALFLGGFGAHHFYGQHNGRDYLRLVLLDVHPCTIALFEALTMKGTIAITNREIAEDVMEELEMIG